MRGFVVNKAPNPVLVGAITVVILSVLGCLTFLVWLGKDTASVFQMVNLLIGALSTFSAAGAMVYAGAAARQSDKAVEQTNGQLDERIKTAITTALTDAGHGGTVPPQQTG